MRRHGRQGSTPAFVGRAPELASLVEAFDRASGGRAAVALVGGEAGVGKSRLTRELGAHARGANARVLVGHCLDLEEGGLPYAPFVEVVRTLERDLKSDEGGAAVGPLRAALGGPAAGTDAPEAGAPTPGAPAGPPGQFGRARVFELLLTLLDRLTADRPVVLVIEDVHWADRSTDDLITLLSASAQHLPLLLVVTYRTDDAGRRHGLHTLLDELSRRGATHVRLTRLDRGEVVELAGALLGTPPAAELAAVIADRSDGNPLFVEELVAAVAGDPGAPMPPHLRDAVLSRVRRMPPEAAGVLRACAVAGRQVEHGLLARVASPPALDDDRLVDALRTCVEHQLLLADNDLGGYRFRHALVHEAVLDEILPGELARLHRAYAVALAGDGPAGAGTSADDGDRSARLAHHWSAAGDYDAALAAAVRAGVGAERAFAVPEAHRYLEWSVRLWDRAADPVGAAGCDRGDLLARAAAAANWAGAMTRALTLVDEALATEPVMADPVRAGLLHERRGWYLLRAGRDADALAAYDRAVALVPPAPPTAARARVVQAQGHALLRAGRHAEAGRRAEEALALAQATDDVPDEGQARHVMGLVLAAEGRSDEAVAQLHEAGQIAVGLGDLAEVAGAYVHLWRTLVEAGRGGDLVDLVFGVLPAGEDASPSLMGSIAAAALQQLGRWEEADRLLGGDRNTGGGGTSLTAVTRTLVSGALAVDRGDHDLARDRLETARAWCHQAGDGRLNGLLHRALAELAVWQERFDDARQEVATGLGLLAHTGDPELEARLAAVGLRAEADRAAARARATGAGATGAAGTTAGRGAEVPPEAADLMAHLDALAEAARARNAPPTCETFAARLTGHAELSRITGRPDPGRWAQAIAAWDGIGFPYAAAYARYRRAEAVLTAGGDRDEAVASLGRAHGTAVGLGARPLAAAVERLARRARVDVARSGTIAGPGPAVDPVDAAEAVAPFAPTPREAEVLALVAQGLTNRQIGEALFISEKTASVHVSRLLAKLGASTRGEAVAVARRRGVLRER
jgi:DNA-binding CsgD family transcriptional regulator/tetratricopeptide (TPR) repeat protein